MLNIIRLGGAFMVTQESLKQELLRAWIDRETMEASGSDLKSTWSSNVERR